MNLIAVMSQSYSFCEPPFENPIGGEPITNYPVLIGFTALIALIAVAALSKWLRTRSVVPMVFDDVWKLRRSLRLCQNAKAGVPYATKSAPGSSRR